MLYFCLYAAPMGQLTLLSDGSLLTEVRLQAQTVPDAICAPSDAVLQQAARWLDGYFAGEAPALSVLPLMPEQTAFRQEIRQLLCTIPRGAVTTYGALAQAAAQRLNGRPCPQAVGQAMGHNPLPILVPCHRVVGAGGRLTGYSGGLEIKRQLLQLEGIPLTADDRIADFSRRFRLPEADFSRPSAHRL